MDVILLLTIIFFLYLLYLYIIYGWKPSDLYRRMEKQIKGNKKVETEVCEKKEPEKETELIISKKIFPAGNLSDNQKVHVTAKDYTKPLEAGKSLDYGENKNSFVPEMTEKYPRVVPPAKVEVLFSADEAETPVWADSPEAAEAEELERQTKNINWEEEDSIAGKYALELDSEGEPLTASGLPIEEVAMMVENLQKEPKELNQTQRNETRRIVRSMENSQLLETMKATVPKIAERILEYMDELDSKKIKKKRKNLPKQKLPKPSPVEWNNFDINQYS